MAQFLSMHRNRYLLALYDLLILVVTGVILFAISKAPIGWPAFCYHGALAAASIFLCRFLFKVYQQIWRYGGINGYLRLLLADGCAYLLYWLIEYVIYHCNPDFVYVSSMRALAYFAVDCLAALAARLVYRYIFKNVNRSSSFGRFCFKALNLFGRTKIKLDDGDPVQKIKIAIVGAGRIGTSLAEDLLNNPSSSFKAVVFIDHLKEKIGREVYDIPVIGEEKATPNHLKDLGVQEVVFAVADMSIEHEKELYDLYAKEGFRIKTYDYPELNNPNLGGKRALREFDVTELLFRKPVDVLDEKTIAFYKGKSVLVTGGGGSIGSELCRQLAKMEPKRIIVLDIAENGAYDIQQELKMAYQGKLDLQVEICSIANEAALEKVFATYRPNIVIMAAAHKHVPLMEHNVVEAVANNVFGTLNTVKLAEKYGADRVHMVSTDKAVNPTSIMGATKRICEMICQSHSTKKQHTTFSATRFGNVLGSAGSVIPLFKRQIAAGGPITITDKRIIRYFMTIPEASQLVLISAAMAHNGELFALDMGEPVKIYDLAINLIKLSGFVPEKDIKIIETGLRPGEKLYEELLVKNEELDKTDNKMIFIERDKPLSLKQIDEKLTKLQDGVLTNDDKAMKDIIKAVVPTFIEKEQANKHFDGKER